MGHLRDRSTNYLVSSGLPSHQSLRAVRSRNLSDALVSAARVRNCPVARRTCVLIVSFPRGRLLGAPTVAFLGPASLGLGSGAGSAPGSTATSASAAATGSTAAPPVLRSYFWPRLACSGHSLQRCFAGCGCSTPRRPAFAGASGSSHGVVAPCLWSRERRRQPGVVGAPSAPSGSRRSAPRTPTSFAVSSGQLRLNLCAVELRATVADGRGARRPSPRCPFGFSRR